MRRFYAIVFVAFASVTVFFWMIAWGFSGRFAFWPDASLLKESGGWLDWMMGLLALYGPVAVTIWAFSKVVAVERERSGKK